MISFRGGPARTLLSPVGAIFTALISVATLALAARSGQLIELAAYAAGVSVAAISNVIVGGGTTLRFVTGDKLSQQAVRRVRSALVAPLTAAVSIAAAAAYSEYTSLPTIAVALGSTTAICNNLSEIEVGYLRSQLATPSILFIDFVTRFSALLLLAMDTNIALAMAVAAGARWIGLSTLSRRDPSRGQLWIPTRRDLRLAYNFDLVATGFLYAVLDRLNLLAAPIALSGPQAGGLATTMSIQQSSAGVALAGPQTTLAIRSRSADPPDWLDRIDTVVLVATLSISACIALTGGIWVDLLGMSQVPNIEVIWPLSWAALPVAVYNRSVQFRLLARQEASKVARYLSVGVFAALSLTIFGILHESVLWIAATPLAGEAACLVALLLARTRKGRHDSPHPRMAQ